MKFQIPSNQLQTNSNLQILMIRTVLNFEIRSLVLVWNLACLREARLPKPCAAGRRFGEGRYFLFGAFALHRKLITAKRQHSYFQGAKYF
jgi:hypothetical protein